MYLSLADGLPQMIYDQRLVKAVDFYTQAAQCACNPEEASSAHRNLGQALMKQAQRAITLLQRLEHSCAALHHLSAALGSGLSCKHRDWCEAIEEMLEGCEADLHALLPLADSVDDALLRRWMQRIAEAASEGLPAYKTEKWMQLAEYVYKSGIYVLERDIYLHQCICDCIKARETAAAILQRSLAESETLDMEAVWLVIDMYKQAAILTRERAVDQEALALARLGLTYETVMRARAKATEYLKAAFQLANTLVPVPYNQDWFKDIIDTLQRLQREAALQEEKERHRERAPILEALKDELAAIKRAADAGTHRLIQHIYKVHPPKNPRHSQPDMSPDNMKKGLLAAITHYHPDKQRQKDHGAEWCVLAEEICKALNIKYEMFKG
ncbi:hypothetical protein WJX72_011214 [[Myrmecia] bisecta]|uniref:Uncharacterized protein n=1 Tax=[Myrmecia] bisecta TaxID=41462 RepID=A0AAW1R9S2_9CHLO